MNTFTISTNTNNATYPSNDAAWVYPYWSIYPKPVYPQVQFVPYAVPYPVPVATDHCPTCGRCDECGEKGCCKKGQ